MSSRRLAFVIHDLNPWGGQDRSTLEVARRLSRRFPTDVYAYTLNDPKLSEWGDLRFHPIAPHVKRPSLVRENYFFGATLAAIAASRLRGEVRPLIHATGACSLLSDLVQVQFVGAAWQKRQANIPADFCSTPFARGQKGWEGQAREVYHQALLKINVGVEHRVYTPNKTYIAIARSVEQELREHFSLKNNIHVIHHGVDSQLFSPAIGEGLAARAQLRAELGVNPHEVLIAFVGAYERKGLAVAIDALGKLSKAALAQVRLMAVGSGAADGFRARARSLGVEDRLILVGHTPDVLAYYRAADSFLLPTFYEPFGLVILEAMSCGLVSVVSQLAGAAELIEDGVSGLLIQNPEDAVEIARHLERMIREPGLRQRLSAGGRAVAMSRSWDRVAEQYAEVIEPLLTPGYRA